MAKGSSVQTLYELCKRTFLPSGASPPSSHAIQTLASLMDTITPAEVGLKEETLEDERGHGFFGSSFSNYPSRTARWAQPITYLHIYECDSFTIAIFCLPTSSVIPLHDHPGMTVLSKILYGSLHVKSYDWVEPASLARATEPFNVPVRLAKLHSDAVLMAPCQTRILYPKTGGNLHCFTAVTPCAVLDVLAPPYDEAAGRSCTYYRDFPFSSFQGSKNSGMEEREEEYAWLEAIDQPDNLYMRSGIYTGPAVQYFLVDILLAIFAICLCLQPCSKKSESNPDEETRIQPCSEKSTWHPSKCSYADLEFYVSVLAILAPLCFSVLGQ